MKKTILNFSISFFSCLIFSIIFSLVLAILKNNNTITIGTANTMLTILSVLIFFIFGFLFSFKQKKRGIINALFLIALYLIVYFILKGLDKVTTPIYMIAARSGAILLGSLFGVNIAPKGAQKD